ncbi:hypothetical protein BDD12DRAFT_846510 [Trichophaea hybrida]|nr:hypothetical protein BDD12DRAFT_846510 [Trichophaea hybrida]
MGRGAIGVMRQSVKWNFFVGRITLWKVGCLMIDGANAIFTLLHRHYFTLTMFYVIITGIAHRLFSGTRFRVVTTINSTSKSKKRYQLPILWAQFFWMSGISSTLKTIHKMPETGFGPRRVHKILHSSTIGCVGCTTFTKCRPLVRSNSYTSQLQGKCTHWKSAIKR